MPGATKDFFLAIGIYSIEYIQFDGEIVQRQSVLNFRWIVT